jgi:lipopolysaccharide transport system permease protein
VKYRDVQYAIPFLTQVWMFLTPIAYPSSLIPEKWRLVYGLNPMAGVVDCFRWSLLGNAPSSLWPLAISTLAVVIAFVGGLAYFRRVEKTFADLV